MYRAGMKIPEPLFLELDPSVMDRPFFIMHRMPGRTAVGAAAAVEPEPLRRKLADEFITEMARLHKLDWRALKMEWLGAPKDLAEPARAQTMHWFDLYNQDRMNEAWPILDAAFAWLKANPVVADRIAIVHGDFRSGNFLFDDGGLITMLDWEMTHLGDPLEDLGWSSMRLWGLDNLAGGLIDRDEYIRLYERKSGAAVDRKRLFFYQVLRQREDGGDLPDRHSRPRRRPHLRRHDGDTAQHGAADPARGSRGATEAGLSTHYAATHAQGSHCGNPAQHH